MVAGPELARIVEEFKGNISSAEDHHHHEQKHGFKSAFAKDVKSLISSFEEMGNPFTEEGLELVAIHTKDVMDAAVVNSVQKVSKIEEQQFKNFVKERFIDRSKLITDPLKKNNLATFSTQGKKLFSRLYIACQSRDGNVEEFFKYENQPWPPPLSQMGNLRGGHKADLVKCLPTPSTQITESPIVVVVILDGAVIDQMLPPKTTPTSDEYFNAVYICICT